MDDRHGLDPIDAYQLQQSVVNPWQGLHVLLALSASIPSTKCVLSWSQPDMIMTIPLLMPSRVKSLLLQVVTTPMSLLAYSVLTATAAPT